MGVSSTAEKQEAHDLIDRLAPGQVAAVVHLLRVMSDPLTLSLANAPLEDEPISDDEVRAVQASKDWLKEHTP
ncbi:MAG: hypothetical protein H0X25_11245, partial [Acidobacteriales bacterium]|nr:hypothetical protein [Terriglobales bacterium]